MTVVSARNDTNSPFTIYDVDNAAVTFAAMGGSASGDFVTHELAALQLLALSGNIVSGVPVNTVAPAITGTAQVGQTLTTTNGTWVGSPTFARQWTANGANISAATATTYQPVIGDIGKVIRCVVTATNAYGVKTATSNATAAVIAA